MMDYNQIQNAKEDLQLRYKLFENKMLDIFQEYSFNKLVDTLTFQVISAYSGLKLFDTFLTFENYVQSETFSKIFKSCSCVYLKTLNIKLTKEDMEDFKRFIECHAYYVLLTEEYEIGSGLDKILPIGYELCKDKK